MASANADRDTPRWARMRLRREPTWATRRTETLQPARAVQHPDHVQDLHTAWPIGVSDTDGQDDEQLFGTVVSYPAWLTLPLAVVAVLGVFLLLWFGRRGLPDGVGAPTPAVDRSRASRPSVAGQTFVVRTFRL